MFIGWVDSPLRMDTIVLNLPPEKLQYINLEIFDSETRTEASRMYPVGSVPNKERNSSARFQAVRQLEHGQHTWTLVIDSLPEYASRWRSGKPTWVAASGILLSLLISVLVVWKFQHKKRLIRTEFMERVAVENAVRIEELNQAKRKLLESERDVNDAQRIARIGSYITDLKTGVCRTSPILDNIFGIDEMFDKTIGAWGKLMAPGYEQEMLDYYHDVVQKRIPFNKDYQIIRPEDGKLLWVSGLGEMEFDDDGNPVFLRGTIQDITERKLSEIALQESQERLQATLNAIPDVLFELGLDGRIYDYHASEPEQLAMPPEELLGKRVADSYPADVAATIMAALQEANQTGHSFGQQIMLAMPQGERCFEISIARKAALSIDETRFIALSRDITERKVAEERMNELSYRLVLVQENARKRLSGELHDRTSPNLAAIGINLNMITSTFHYTGTEYRESSSILVNCIEDIQALIEDTTVSIREICSDLRPPVLDYGGLVPALENYVAQFHQRTNLLVEIACPNSSIRLPSALESALFRIVQEALTNCAKHSHAMSVKIALDLESQPIVLSVCDDGIGFDPKAQEEVFPRSGLGILTMKEMVEFLEGEFDLVSILGEGTRVTVKFLSSGETA